MCAYVEAASARPKMMAAALLLLSLSAAAIAGPVSQSWISLADGTKKPSISLGTCCGSSPSVGVASWVAAGGIGIDTSIDYQGGRGEAEVAAALATAKVKRADVYITTKVTAGCDNSGYQCNHATAAAAMASVHTSLKNLGTDYIDMILLHRPCEQSQQNCSIAAKLSNCTGPITVKNPAAANNQLWKGLQQAKAMGLVRSIGVSNYFAGQIAALEGEKPAINQCESSIQGYDNATISYCQKNGITYESYGSMRGCPFTDPTLAVSVITLQNGATPVKRRITPVKCALSLHRLSPRPTRPPLPRSAFAGFCRYEHVCA